MQITDKLWHLIVDAKRAVHRAEHYLRLLATYTRKRRWKETKPEDMITLDHASPYFGYIAPYIGIGAAGLGGEAFNIYLRLKNGDEPLLASMMYDG